MCGIAGVAAVSARAVPSAALVDAMCQTIRHRGPDDQGVHGDQFAQIGMRRLSIIDLSGGHQPIHNEDETIWLVFNGEIYNFKELRRELEACGHVFYTDSDGECIVHAYEQYGDECFAQLRGMFAIAILDRRHNRLVLARDRLGKKPLYYTRTKDDLLAFASELKALTIVPGFDPEISAAATREYFSLGYVPAPSTIYRNASKLPGAHYLVLERGQISVRRYWSLAFEDKWTDPESTLKERLHELLDEAVRIRLVSDVPFGAFLSGGIDSSVVTALMARHMTSPVKTFTIGFAESAFDETPDARRVAEHIGSEHHELMVTPDAVGLLEKLAWHFDEPFADSSAIPTFLVSQLAARHVKMVLSGDGGDEGFAGYERYRKFRQLNAIARSSLGLAKPALGILGAAVPGHLGVRLGRIGDRLGQPYPDRYISGVALTTPGDVNPLLADDLLALDPLERLRPLFMRADITSENEQILAGDMQSYLVDDVLVKVDRMSMANSLETRAPLLDHVLLEFCARLPFSLKDNGRTAKYLLKEVARDLLPVSCLQKRKQGFAIPLARWFRNEFKPLMSDLISDRRFRERGVFNAQRVELCYRSHLAGTQDFSELLWLVLTYEMWARQFTDDSASNAPGRRAAA